MTENTILQIINKMQNESLKDSFVNLLNYLGYTSDKTLELDKEYSKVKLEINNSLAYKLNDDKCLSNDWKEFVFLFQFSPEETKGTIFGLESANKNIQSFVFLGLQLKKESYSRTELTSITRELNKAFSMPAIVFFRFGSYITISVIDRRKSKRINSTNEIVLEKVTLIHKINLLNPHRAHSEILSELNFDTLRASENIHTFEQLYEAITKVLDIKLLNKRFYKEIFYWYLWASKEVEFPNLKIPVGSGRKKEKYFTDEKDIKNHTSVSLIRLLTRLIFVWFLKEKKIIPNSLFEEDTVKKVLKDFSPKGKKSIFYKAILQNLFFATLNKEMNFKTSQNRYFVSDSKEEKERRKEFGVKNLYRYKDYFSISENDALNLFNSIPFLNGGLFECLDKDLIDDINGKPQITHYVFLDGFSREEEYSAKLPDYLFFGQEKEVDLSQELDDKKAKKCRVNSLIPILQKYKFTIEENTPLEEDIALDPELLGKVFENLLAAYNPETSTTARKQTGSFYTPREIVDYMVDESLIAYFKTFLTKESVGHEVFGTQETTMFPEAVHKKGQQFFTAPIESNPWKGKEEELEKKLRTLFEREKENSFSPEETKKLIKSLHEIKILDPACGSGAFPMGILNRMVHILQKLDRENKLWEKIQMEYISEETKEKISALEKDTQTAKTISLKEAKELALQILEEKKKEIQNAFHKQLPDYARKLYLIENCIYGVDIQPIAVQISKLRFFISLIIDQKLDDNEPNRGILSLPNLETKFVAANTLIGLDLPKEEGMLSADQFQKERDEIKSIRHLYFQAKLRDEKKKLEKREKEIRRQIQNKILEKDIKELDEIIKHLEGKKLGANVLKELKKIKEERKIHPETIHKSLQSLPKEFDPGIKKKLLELAKGLVSSESAEQIANWNPYDQNAHAEWFDPEWMFGASPPSPPQLGRGEGGGVFDVVIGNPPYVESKKLKEIAKKLKDYKTGSGTADLYVYFFEKGINVLKSKSILTFIVSNKFMKTSYGGNLRAFLLENKINSIADFTEVQIFDALVASCIIIIEKNKKENHEILYSYINDSFINYNNLYEYIRNHHISKSASKLSNEIWHFSNDLISEIKGKLERNGVKFIDIESIKIYRGVTTGFNPAFIIDELIRKELIKEDKNNKEIIKPLLQGRNIRKWIYNETSDYLIFTRRGIDIKKFPKIKMYLSEFKAQLEPGKGRKAGQYNWYEIQDNTAYFEEFEKEKIIWGLTSDKWTFAYDNGKHYLPSNGYILTSKNLPIKYLLSLLNSKVLEFYFGFIGIMTAGGAFTLKLETVSNFPIPKSPIDNPALQKPLIALVDKILAAKQPNPQPDSASKNSQKATPFPNRKGGELEEILQEEKDRGIGNTSKWEAEIDARVFHLYGLSEEEMLTVLNSFPKMNDMEKLKIQNFYRDIENGVLK